MNKIIIFTSLFALAFSSNAQNLTFKNSTADCNFYVRMYATCSSLSDGCGDLITDWYLVNASSIITTSGLCGALAPTWSRIVTGWSCPFSPPTDLIWTDAEFTGGCNSSEGCSPAVYADYVNSSNVGDPICEASRQSAVNSSMCSSGLVVHVSYTNTSGDVEVHIYP
jgi:hypothetical protein